MNMSYVTSCTFSIRRHLHQVAEEKTQIFDKKRVHRHWLPPVALGSLEIEFPWLRLPTALSVLLQRVLEKCELTIRQCSDENGSVYLILSQSGWCFHNVDICWHISMRCLLQDAWVMPTIRICKMMFFTAAQNRCINSMPKMAHAPDKFRTPEEQFLENSCLFKVIRSASLFQLPSLLHRL